MPIGYFDCASDAILDWGASFLRLASAAAAMEAAVGVFVVHLPEGGLLLLASW